MAKKKGPKVFRRRLIGLNIVGGGRGGPPLVYALYEEDLLEKQGKTLVFTTRGSRGDTIQVVEHSGMLSGSKREKAYYLQAFRPDLYTNIQATAILFQQLQDACLSIDKARGKGELND